MCKEDYVSLETAKLLKEKGFDAECDYEYGVPVVEQGYVLQRVYKPIKNSELIDGAYAAPTLQMAMKWLRKVHHYYIQIMLDNWVGIHVGYFVIIMKTDSDFELQLYDEEEQVFYETPEEACEAAMKYSLENLI